MGIMFCSLPDRLPVHMNELAEKMLGFSKTELHQSVLDFIIHPDDRSNAISFIKRFKNSEVQADGFGCRFVTKGGNTLQVDVNISIIQSENELMLVTFREASHGESTKPGDETSTGRLTQDSSGVEAAKERLAEKNRELQEIMDALDESSLVSIADKNGVILKVNRRFCEVAKYKPEELIGRKHSIINSGYHSRKFWKGFWKTIQRGEVWRGEIRNRAKDGSEYWVNTTIKPISNEKGEVVHYLSIRQDITSRKIYEELLIQSNLRLAQIEQFIDYTTDAIQVSDLNGQFVYINHVASQRLGIAKEDCTKYNVKHADVLFSNDWEEHVIRLKKAGAINVEGVSRNHATGLLHPVELTMRHISIHDKDYVVVVSRDITERKKNEIVLKESQDRLAEAQRMAKLGYCEFDLLKNELWWSDEQYRINGLLQSGKSLTHRDFLALLHPDDRQLVTEMMSKAIVGNAETSLTYRIVRPDGEVRLILGYVNVIRNEEGQAVKLSGVNQDITDRMMTEKALRESEETLRKAQAVAKIGSWKLDVKNGHLEWSDEVYRIFDVPKERVVTESDFLSYVHPEDRDFVEKSWTAALSGDIYDIVHRIIVNNKVKWVREQAQLTFDDFRNLIYGFGTVQDITDQKSLQDSNLIFNQSLLLTGLGSWRATFKNRDLFISDNVYNLHGKAKDVTKVTYDNFLDFIYPEDRRRIQFILAKVLTKKGSFQTEYRVEKAPGEVRWLSAKGKVLADADGNAIEMYGIVRDITMEKNNTAELIKARREAEEASYIKDEFLSVMSHEIRTPLNSVIGLSNLILKRNPRADQLEIMRTLKGSADNLLHLVNDILDFNKIRAGKLQLEFIPFSLTKFLQHLHASFKLSAIDKRIDFSIHADAQIPDLLIGDVTRLNQIFNNLLGNAIKFTHKGHVRFKVDLKGRSKGKCMLLFSIEDTGVGITSEKLETIFLPFHQSERDTARKYGGTGLGLSIVKSLVEILEGNIVVNSIPGKGSVFSVELSFPGARSLSQKDNTPGPDQVRGKYSAPVRLKQRLKVLYVEDVESNRFLVEHLLSDHHIDAVTASSGKEALRLTTLRKFDLIIMDIQMPGMDGYQTTGKMRSQKDGRNISTPVLAFTAEPFSEELRKKVLFHGIQDVLTKPFDEDTLIDKIRSCTQRTSTNFFSFSFYEDVFNHDDGKLKEVRKSVIKDIQRFKTRIQLYERRKNWKGVAEEVHRMRPIFKNLNCMTLMLLFEDYQLHAADDPGPGEIIRSMVQTSGVLLTLLGQDN